MNTNSTNKIMWLTSYPKSGNTWLRFALTSLIQPDFERSAEVKHWIPDVHESPFQLRTHPKLDFGFAKTHYQFSEALPFKRETSGFIYILRNPIDGLISNYNYFLRTSNISPEESESKNLKELYVKTFIKNGGDIRWIKAGMGSWIDNLKSWLTVSKEYPSCFVKYEEMKADPKGTISRLANFLGLDKTDQDISDTVLACSFTEMQALERKEMNEKTPGMFYYADRDQRHSDKNNFVRKGRSDFGKKELPPELREMAVKYFQPALDWLKYETDLDMPQHAEAAIEAKR